MHRLCGEDYCLCEETPRQSGTWLLFGLEFRLGATKFFVTYEITFFEAGFEDSGHQGHETQAVQREHALRQILEVQGTIPGRGVQGKNGLGVRTKRTVVMHIRPSVVTAFMITQRRGECQPVFSGTGESVCALNPEMRLCPFARCPANGPVRIKTPRTF